MGREEEVFTKVTGVPFSPDLKIVHCPDCKMVMKPFYYGYDKTTRDMVPRGWRCMDCMVAIDDDGKIYRRRGR